MVAYRAAALSLSFVSYALAAQLLVSGTASVSFLDFDETAKTLSAKVAVEAPYSWLTLNDKANLVYATDENSGKVATCTVDAKAGTLTPIGEGTSVVETTGPVHNTLSLDEKILYTSQYTTGGFNCFPIGEDGAPGEGMNLAFGEGSKGHQVVTDPTNKYVLVPDLGSNVTQIIDMTSGKPVLMDPIPVPGGPRHAVFSSDGSRLHVVTELGNMVHTCNVCYSKEGPKFTAQGEGISTLGDDAEGKSAAAEILLSPNGKFLLTSNRPQTTPVPEGTIAVFSIGEETEGEPLKQISVSSSGGTNPRSMSLNQAGTHLAVTNQGTEGSPGSVAIFEFDQKTGKLGAKPIATVAEGVTGPQTVVWVEEKKARKPMAIADMPQCDGEGSATAPPKASGSKPAKSSAAQDKPPKSSAVTEQEDAGPAVTKTKPSAKPSFSVAPSESSAKQVVAGTFLGLALLAMGV